MHEERKKREDAGGVEKMMQEAMMPLTLVWYIPNTSPAVKNKITSKS